MANRFRYSVSVSLEKMPRKTPFLLQGSLRESVAILKEYGYEAAELQIHDPKDFAEDWFLEYCAKNGFSVSAFGTGTEYTMHRLALSSPSSEVRKAAVARIKEHIDLASRYQTDVIIGTIRGLLEDGVTEAQYADYVKEALSELCDYALPKGVNLLVEAINLYVIDVFNSVRQVSDLLDSVSAPNLKAHIDTHHMAIEEKDMLQSIADCGTRIGYVHFSENNRLYPGGGSVDFPAVMRKLIEIGYSGFIALECIPVPDGITGLKLGMENLRKFESLL